jgi:ParB family transcriptional regulator, chromosome partitioning protein
MSEARFVEETEVIRFKDRTRAKGNQFGGKEIFPDHQKGQTRDKVAEQVGFGSGRTYERAKKV